MVKRSDGRWQQKVTIKGRPHYFYGRTKSEVLQKIQAYQGEQEKGPLFEVVAEEWWDEHSATLQSNTIKSYKPALERAIVAFQGWRCRDITPAMIKSEIAAMAKSRADKTVRTQLMVYNLIFKYAVTSDYCPTNPAREVSVPHGLPKKKISSPSDEDIERVKRGWGCTFGMIAYMALYTGLRRGELLALEWSDIDLDARTITVSKSLVHISNRPSVKRPKTAAGERVVPVLDALLPKLHKSAGLVFPGKSGHMTETEFQACWAQYTKESGVTCTLHQLRHAFATMLFEHDVAGKDAQGILGHAQLTTTMDIYTDIREQRKKAVFEALYKADI